MAYYDLAANRRQFRPIAAAAEGKAIRMAEAMKQQKMEIDAKAEASIMRELKKEAAIISWPSNPVTFYNYSYLKEMLEKKHQVFVSLPTIIRRAKKMGITRSARTARHMIGKS